MDQFGIKSIIVSFFCFVISTLYCQAPLESRIILSDRIIFGTQVEGDGSIRPGTGVVRVLSDDKYSTFTHYQYGTTIRTDENEVEFISLDTSGSAGIVNIKRNNCSICYGSRLHVRDRDDIYGLELSSGFLHNGFSSLHSIANNFTIVNSANQGEARIYVGVKLIGTFNHIGFQYHQYTTSQRDAMNNINPGTTIFNLNIGINQVWDGTNWQ